jgi:hypothetical protein
MTATTDLGPLTEAPPADAASTTVVDDGLAVAWQEGTRTRATELEALCAWVQRTNDADPAVHAPLRAAVALHLAAARRAAEPWHHLRSRRMGGRLERAISNLDGAEASILQMAPARYIVGQVPSLLNHVQRHLQPGDPRRTEMERIAKRVLDEPAAEPDQPGGTDRREAIVRDARGAIVSAVRGASSAALREQTRVRSFRNVVAAAAIVMATVAGALAIVGWASQDALPLCFTPEEAGQTTVACPTAHRGPIPSVGTTPEAGDERTTAERIDQLTSAATQRHDILVVELVGVAAAGVAAASALRRIRGSSEPYGIPIALAVLKLPTGAVTAVVGLLLMRGGFVPGLSALDTSAQIIAWAIVFGYAQQLFTRLVDQQAHVVLDRVRGARTAEQLASS